MPRPIPYRTDVRYPGPGGTVGFLTTAYGRGLVPASLSVLLVLIYVAIMSVYASAMASTSTAYLSEGMRAIAHRVIASAAIAILGFINFAGARLRERMERIFNVGKLALSLFIVAGLLIGEPDLSRRARGLGSFVDDRCDRNAGLPLI